jgi:formamidopyrimidine-DNA glycosylase
LPELPEVETTRRGLQPHLVNQHIQCIEVRQPKLRWPVPDEIQNIVGAGFTAIERRGKYLLMYTDQGNLIWHLGMSGSLRVLPQDAPALDHEHVKLVLNNGQSLRFRDPRRFGALLYTREDPLQHQLIRHLGPEPLSEGFNDRYLQQQCTHRQSAIKNVIMDSQVVVGIGNIYACESLFLSRINPKSKACRISPARLHRLVDAIKQVLRLAIEQGGTTLQDFTRSDGLPGYFSQSLQVYGRESLPCNICGHPITRTTIGQRSTFYCTHCQH